MYVADKCLLMCVSGDVSRRDHVHSVRAQHRPLPRGDQRSAAAAAGGALSVDPGQAVGDLGGISDSGRSGAADVASGAGGVSADGSAGGLVHSAAVRDAAGDTVLAGADVP